MFVNDYNVSFIYWYFCQRWSLSPSTPLHRWTILLLQCLVHTSHAVSLEIHGHVCKAIFFEGFHDLVAVLQNFLEFIWQYFNSRQCTMNTHTQLMKSQIQKQLLCFVYHAKFLLSDGPVSYTHLDVYKRHAEHLVHIL